MKKVSEPGATRVVGYVLRCVAKIGFQGAIVGFARAEERDFIEVNDSSDIVQS